MIATPRHILLTLLTLAISTLPFGMIINGLSIIVLTAYWIFYLFKTKSIKIRNIIYFLLSISIFVLGVIGLLYSENMTRGLHHLETSLSILIFPLVFSTTPRLKKTHFHFILISFAVACVLKYLLVIFSFSENDLFFDLEYTKVFFFNFNKVINQKAIHPSYFSMFLSLCIFILIGFVSSVNSIWAKLLLVCGALLILLFCLTLSSKMPLIAIIVAAIVVSILFLYKHFKVVYLTYYSVGVIIILLLGYLYFNNFPSRIKQDLYNYNNYLNNKEITDYYSYKEFGVVSPTLFWAKVNRLKIWKTSFEVVKENFFLGVGTGDVQSVLNEQYKKNKESKYMYERNTGSHNQYLDFTLRYGILGPILYLILLGINSVRAFKTSNYLFISFIIIIVFCSFTENILNRQYGVVFFSFFNSLFYYQSPKKKET